MQNSKCKIIFFGTPEFVIPILENLNQHFEVLGVVTAADEKMGRRQILTPSAVKSYARNHSIPNILTPNQLDSEFQGSLKKLNPDLYVVAAYGKIIPQQILDIPKFGSLNIHPSLLPKFRGPSPIQAAILAGLEETGVTIIKMDEKMDHGPIIYQKKIAITNEETLETFSNKLFNFAAAELTSLIPKFIEGSLKLREQDHNQATFCKLINKEGGYFDIDNPPDRETLDKMIRAYYSWPTAWTKWNGKVVKFLPGRLIQLEGKNPVHLKNFLNGYPNFPLKEV
jgi:methionyl-tRNA formyltransferase